MSTQTIHTETLHDNSVQAQRERLLTYLKAHGQITTIRAKEVLNIYNPPARKWELCHLYGYRIKTAWTMAVNAQGFMHRVGLYILEQEDQYV